MTEEMLAMTPYMMQIALNQTLQKIFKGKTYCGPSVRGVARQYTSFSGELPESMKRFIEQHPMAESLIVPYDKVAETRARMEQPEVQGQPKTAERVIYEQLKAEL